MMRLFVDPTELAPQSRLEKAVAGVAIPLPGLETRTGADLLLTLSKAPLTADSPDALLRIHCNAGILVQLKRRGDLMTAITTEQRLFYEVQKMAEWSSRSWLVVTGMLFEHQGKAIIGEVKGTASLHAASETVVAQVAGRPGLAFNAVDGAVDAWRYYGGYAKFLPDGHLMSWLKRQAQLVQAIMAGEVTELKPRGPQRELKAPTTASWISALFQGVGIKTAHAILSKLEEESKEGLLDRNNALPIDLITAITYILDYRAAVIPGITEEMIAGWRNHFGLLQTNGMYETLGVQYRDRETGAIWHWSRGE